MTVEKLAEGVYLLGGGPANSVAVEFRNFVAVFEAPTSEARSLAVIEQIAKLMPGKPIRYLVNSHQHFDHIGGIRTYLHIGATIVTQRKNITFLNRDVLNYRPRTVLPDMVSLWPPTEVAEGYNYESFNENYVITDGTRLLQVYYVQPLRHAEGMAMAYLPAREDRDAGQPVRHARTGASRAHAGDDDVLPHDADAEPGRGHDRAGARQACADGRVHQGDGVGRHGVPRGWRRRFRGVGTLPITPSPPQIIKQLTPARSEVVSGRVARQCRRPVRSHLREGREAAAASQCRSSAIRPAVQAAGVRRRSPG